MGYSVESTNSNVFKGDDGWYFYDETGDTYGPFFRRLEAERQSDLYFDYMMYGPPKNIS